MLIKCLIIIKLWQRVPPSKWVKDPPKSNSTQLKPQCTICAPFTKVISNCLNCPNCLSVININNCFPHFVISSPYPPSSTLKLAPDQYDLWKSDANGKLWINSSIRLTWKPPDVCICMKKNRKYSINMHSQSLITFLSIYAAFFDTLSEGILNVNRSSQRTEGG